MPKIRVVLAGMSRLMRDALRDVIERAADFEVTADLAEPTGLGEVLGESRAQVIIVDRHDLGGRSAREALFALRPQLVIVGVARGAVVIERLGAPPAVLADPSPPSVLEAVRRAVDVPPGSNA